MSCKPTRPLLTRRHIIAATAGLAAGIGGGNAAHAQDDSDGLPAGGDALNKFAPAPAPALAFTNAAGRPLTLRDYAGRGLVVNLWATWCGPCVAEIPSFAAVAPELRRLGILILPISIDMGGLQTVKSFYTSQQITSLPILLDTTGDTMTTLKASGIPVTIVINAAGLLVGRYDGAANWNTPGTIATLRDLTATPATPHNDIQPV